MTPAEKTIIANLGALYGHFDTKIVPYIEETQPESTRYWAKKLRQDFLRLFAAFTYERTAYEVEEIRRYMETAQVFVVTPEAIVAHEKAEEEGGLGAG